MKIFRQITANNVILEPYPFKKELTMEAYLMENESVLKLDEPEFYDQPEVLDAEIVLEAGGGRIDLLARYSENTFAIVELKHKEINMSTLKQLEGYLKQRNILEKNHIDKQIKPDNIRWIGILAGEAICPDLQKEILEKGILELENNLKIPIAAITMKRYRGSDRKEIFVITDTYYKRPNTNDYSYYNVKFNGKTLSDKPLRKNAVVEIVIEHYATEHSITFDNLKEIFPAKLSGATIRGCFEDVDKIRGKYADGRTPYMKKEILLSDEKSIRVYNGWTVVNLVGFINKVKDFGYSIERV